MAIWMYPVDYSGFIVWIYEMNPSIVAYEFCINNLSVKLVDWPEEPIKGIET